jgi:hypothetical protein
MKAIPLALLATLLLSSCASPLPPAPISAGSLLGTWKVDLRPVPGAPDYYKAFVVTGIDGKSFSGTFYGSPIHDGRINTDWGEVRFAFVTDDLSGPYNHAGVLRGGKMEGTSHSIGRQFLSYWTAVRNTDWPPTNY